jgi:phenylacetate-coenzyme A ligase PaaK-like adenylate-forming protein
MTTLLDPVILQPLAAELIARDRWSRTELLALQRRRLDEILRTAVSTSPYYRERLGAAVAAGASLADLPVLTKTVLMDEWDRIVTDPRLRLRDVEAHLAGERCGELLFGEYRAFASGGTTGERAVVIYDRTAWLDVIANVLRWVRTLGGGPECRVVGVGPSPSCGRSAATPRGCRSSRPCPSWWPP